MSSIPLPALHIQSPEDPMAQIGKAMQLKSLMQGQQMQNIQLQQAQQQQKDQQTVRKAFQDSNGDIDKTIAAAAKAGVSPQTLTALQAHNLDVKTKLATLNKDQLDNLSKQNDNAAGLIQPILDAPAEKRPALYAQARQQLIQNPQAYGITDPSQIPPEQYPGDDAMRSQLAIHQGGKQQFDNAMKKREVAAQENRARRTGGPEMDAYLAMLNGSGAQPDGSSSPPPDQVPPGQPQASPQPAVPVNPPATGEEAPPAANSYAAAEAAFNARRDARLNGAQPQAVPVASLSPTEALQKLQEMKQGAKPAEKPLSADTIAQTNQAMADRFQILNPGKPLPPQYTLQAGATPVDAARVDKMLEQVEKATGTKAQQDSAAAARSQAANDRKDKEGIQAVVGTDSNGREVLVPESDTKSLGLTSVMKADADLVNKSHAARTWLKLAEKTVPDSSPADQMGIMQLIDRMDKNGKLGVAASRWNDFLAGKLGAGDPDYAALRAKMGLSSTKLMQAHVGSRGGAFMLEHFEDLANAGKMNAATLRSGVASELDYMKDVAMLPQSKGATAGRAAAGGYTPPAGAATAVGPNGHKIVVDDGKWVDAQTGKPIQ